MRGLATALGKAIGLALQPKPAAAVHGGSINESHRWETNAGPVFVKVAQLQRRVMFEAEAAGLDELRRANAVKVPRVLGIAATETAVALALEWIDFGRGSHASETALGEQLAAQHRVSAHAFGWHRDNPIGSTPKRINGAMTGSAFFATRFARNRPSHARMASKAGYRRVARCC